ncbi:hypothetical protein L3X38_004275 [Prunus dulcis]|uniref:Uncharacterized protein n=1 Tax=Prunus dulcis TaxID=3755 RepID=A0AAD4ZNP4_PRUDU|nr:hypothetical protein L3X38_004275 [Prunus dulcis]
MFMLMFLQFGILSQRKRHPLLLHILLSQLRENLSPSCRKFLISLNEDDDSDATPKSQSSTSQSKSSSQKTPTPKMRWSDYPLDHQIHGQDPYDFSPLDLGDD